MNKLDYVNKLLEKEDFSDYINALENNDLISPPSDLKEKILNTCYNNTEDTYINSKYKLDFINVLKVACFSLIITLCTELFMNATYASTKKNKEQIRIQATNCSIKKNIDSTMKNFSNFMLSYNLKGE